MFLRRSSYGKENFQRRPRILKQGGGEKNREGRKISGFFPGKGSRVVQKKDQESQIKRPKKVNMGRGGIGGKRRMETILIMRSLERGRKKRMKGLVRKVKGQPSVAGKKDNLRVNGLAGKNWPLSEKGFLLEGTWANNGKGEQIKGEILIFLKGETQF